MREYNLRTLDNPKSLTAEAYRTLRTNIQFANADKVIRRILFTSAGSEEGKSSIVANLAVSMSQAGKNVIIIDADLRNPSQHKIFGLSNLLGLTITLAEDVPVSDFIVKTPHEGLDILTSGPIPPNPAELLDSRRMKHILNEITQTYDFVLIDSPPVIPVTDASILAQLVDGVVLVLAAREVKREYALRAKEQLEKVGAKILGTILNKAKVQSKKQNYYY
ncbi:MULTISPECIES: CpsD/CapB family tyrosine-protein kinase [unclassified Dehalobacter]|uniref:CpsD/CapB family tyrosine-protein kinase n=1 Tax=unclassified Dehalobacter TaxID=2635733 RepID=UPI000374920B|nr:MULTISPECIES: CpsD/CapB family tyrosine-protein kinase [unclassified Dehalobacter]RJE48982.1 capsular biosynthesis protein [Dehalobacter sp. MCB1]TCX51720.1 capsular biosynthesis protein [Dehalobacter sp. 14DCB1]TCX52780.1 capsular biosynthesis protein [Dehalobacter sp. 12DCB1]